MSSRVFTRNASPKSTAIGDRSSARWSIDSWTAATCATVSLASAAKIPDCRHEMPLAVSCRGRYFCPSCHAKRVAAFASWLESDVLEPVPHRQYVFTIPKLLRLHFPVTGMCHRFDRRLLGLLSACACQSILEMMRAVVSVPGAVPGMVAAIQTYGRPERQLASPCPCHRQRWRFLARRFIPRPAPARLPATPAALRS